MKILSPTYNSAGLILADDYDVADASVLTEAAPHVFDNEYRQDQRARFVGWKQTENGVYIRTARDGDLNPCLYPNGLTSPPTSYFIQAFDEVAAFNGDVAFRPRYGAYSQMFWAQTGQLNSLVGDALRVRMIIKIPFIQAEGLSDHCTMSFYIYEDSVELSAPVYTYMHFYSDRVLHGANIYNQLLFDYTKGGQGLESLNDGLWHIIDCIFNKNNESFYIIDGNSVTMKPGISPITGDKTYFTGIISNPVIRFYMNTVSTDYMPVFYSVSVEAV